MTLRNIIYWTGFASLVLLAVVNCTSGAAQGRTEVLPADGGDPGKSFIELQRAFKAADKGTATKRLAPNSWHLDNKEPGWFEMIYERLAEYSRRRAPSGRPSNPVRGE